MFYYPTRLDGKKFVTWLDSMDVGPEEYPGEKQHYTLSNGENLSVERADTILTHLGMNINQIPIDVWIPHQQVKPETFKLQIERQRECLIA